MPPMPEQDVQYVTIWDCQDQTCMYCGHRGDAMTDGKLVWCRSQRACIQRLVDQNDRLRAALEDCVGIISYWHGERGQSGLKVGQMERFRAAMVVVKEADDAKGAVQASQTDREGDNAG